MRAGLVRNPAYWITLALLGTSAAGLTTALDRFKIMLKKEPIHAPGGRLLKDVQVDYPSFHQLGSDHKEKAEIEETLGTKNYISRTYAYTPVGTPGGKPGAAEQRLEFHAAYYTGMIDTVPHVPDRCFVGAGMLIDAFLGDLPLPLNNDGWHKVDDEPKYHERYECFYIPNSSHEHARARVTLPRDAEHLQLRTTRFLGSGGATVHAGYFFIANGGWVASADDVRLLAFDRKSKYAYYLKVQFSSDTVKSGEDLAMLAAKFLDESLGELLLSVPDWMKVEKGEYPEPDQGPKDTIQSVSAAQSGARRSDKVDNGDRPANK